MNRSRAIAHQVETFLLDDPALVRAWMMEPDFPRRIARAILQDAGAGAPTEAELIAAVSNLYAI